MAVFSLFFLELAWERLSRLVLHQMLFDSDPSFENTFVNFFLFFRFFYLEFSVVTTALLSFDWLPVRLRVSKIRFSIFCVTVGVEYGMQT